MDPSKPSRSRKSLAVLGGLLLCAGAVELGRRAFRTAPAGPGYPVLFLGMSTTVGMAGASYPADVERILRERFGGGFSAVNAAEVGDTEERAAARLEAQLKQYRPKMVVSLIPEGAGKSKTPGRDWIESSPFFAELRRRRPELSKLPPEVPPDPAALAKIENMLMEASNALVRGNRSEAERIIEDGMRAFPEEPRWPITRARLLAHAGDHEQAEIHAARARKMPQSGKAYREWAGYYAAAGRPTLQVAAMENAVILGAASVFHLAEMYMVAGERERAERLLEEALARDPADDLAGLLATLRLQQGRFEEADGYYAMANELRRKHASASARSAYAEMAGILRRHGVPWLCVQVPVRGLESLRELVGPDSGAVFVDNERPFKDEIRKNGYFSLFQDVSLGDSGHFTSKGCRLLAENVVDAILRVDPSLARSGDARAERADPPSADMTKERFFLDLLKDDKADLRARRGLVEIYAERGRWEDVEEQYKQILRVEPKDKNSMVALARAYAAQMKWDLAEEQCGKAIALDPREPRFRRVLAEIYREQRKWPQAEEQYERILAADPDDKSGRMGLGQVYETQRRWKMAEEQYREVRRIDPADVQAMQAFAGVLESQRRWKEAADQYRELLKVEPNNGIAWRALAGIYETQGLLDLAEESYRQRLKIDPDHLGTLRGLARVLEDQRRWQEAVREYRRLLRLSPDDPPALVGLSYCLHRSGREAEAEEALRAALRIEPGYEDLFAKQKEKATYIHETAAKLR